MITVEILKNLVLNISFLAIISQLLTKSPIVKDLVYTRNSSLKSQLILAVIFGCISIVSTYTGIKVNGAIVNTRVIGVMAGGIIGGPVVGFGAAVIGGLHRYFFDVDGFTALACALSTFTEGIIAVLFSRYLKQNKWKHTDIFMITSMAEICQMIIILLVAKPFSEALRLVQIISVPMILFNSVGMVVFIAVFNSIFIEQDNESASRIRYVLDISDKCLPYLRKGLYSRENINKALKILLERSGDMGAVITDTNNIICYECSSLPIEIDDKISLPNVIKRVIKTGSVSIAEYADDEDLFYEAVKKFSIVAAPLKKKGEVIGCLAVFTKKFKLSSRSHFDFVDGVSKLFSTQLELAEIDRQKVLLQKAEFQALQSQINPHFLFNALNTITYFCREKPEKAKELLIALSTYFRNTLNTNNYMISIYDEFAHIESYLQLEKARFDERLELDINFPTDLNCTVPCFILQPIVENAVKHGAMKRQKGKVTIKAEKQKKELIIVIADSGFGIPSDIVEKLYAGTLDSSRVGLSNVHKRLKSIYGEKYGLKIKTGNSGTEVKIAIPLEMGGAYENSSN